VEGKGLLSLLSASTVLAVRIGVVGFDAAVAQFLLVRRVPPATGLGTVFSLAAAAGIAAAVAAHAAIPLMVPGAGLEALPAARIQATVLPAAFLLFVATYALFALDRAVPFAIGDVAYRVGILAVTLAVAALGAGIVSVVASQAVVVVATAATGVGLLWHWSGGAWRWSSSVAVAMVGYGSRTYAYALGRYVLAFGSLLVSGAVLGARDAGLFSVALLLGEGIALTAGSVNLAFGRTVSLSSDPWTDTRRVVVRLGLIMAAMAIAVVAVAPVAIPLVFGPAFAPSASLFLWVAPGAIALGVEQIVGSYFARVGMSWRVAAIMAGSGAVSVTIWSLAARDGLTSLAWTTSALQVIVCALMVWQFRTSPDRAS
jgi:O-antigen/teichoic acid export membrane protein